MCVLSAMSADNSRVSPPNSVSISTTAGQRARLPFRRVLGQCKPRPISRPPLPRCPIEQCTLSFDRTAMYRYIHHRLRLPSIAHASPAVAATNEQYQLSSPIPTTHDRCCAYTAMSETLWSYPDNLESRPQARRDTSPPVTSPPDESPPQGGQKPTRDGSKARQLMFLPSYTEHMAKGPRT